MEPNYSTTNFLVFVLPFAAYYLGILIRKVTLSGANSPRISHQLLLGIPVSLIVVTPLIPVLNSGDLIAYLVTLGIIMEHGMLVNETATHHLKNLLARSGNNRNRMSNQIDDSLTA